MRSINPCSLVVLQTLAEVRCFFLRQSSPALVFNKVRQFFFVLLHKLLRYRCVLWQIYQVSSRYLNFVPWVVFCVHCVLSKLTYSLQWYLTWVLVISQNFCARFGWDFLLDRGLKSCVWPLRTYFDIWLHLSRINCLDILLVWWLLRLSLLQRLLLVCLN